MSNRLALLRKLMRRHNIQAYFIPGSDPHQSEHVPEFWRRRAFISGFTGSAGDALVTMRDAGLWTDSRYFLQAERELRNSTFSLFKGGMPGVPTWHEWAARNLKSGETLGLDPQLVTHRDYLKLKTELGAKDVRLKPLDINLVDAVWPERPDPPADPVTLLAEQYAGESARTKLNRLRRKMAAENVEAHVLSQLDAVAWLFNIRGSDVPFNPVTIAYAIITRRKATLFAGRKKIAPSVRVALKKDVSFRSYSEFPAALHCLAAARKRIWLDEAGVSQWVVSQLEGAKLLFKPSPVLLAKAVKNTTEIKGSNRAHRRDGAAMVEFLFWLEKAVPKGGVTELSAARKLQEIRKCQPRFKGLSFETISAYGSHGAVVHYRVRPETDVLLEPKGVYLIDSGSQYLDATTDITRTVCLGEPTAEQRDRFTRILKGVISLTRTCFPQGTTGPQLDVLARQALWEKGLNYGHGTGHGIGAYLNVHEGPHGIAPARGFGISLEPGMILSIEPGFYKEGKYGLRVENLVLVIRDPARSSGTLPFYTFETLTLCPIELRLIDKAILTKAEVNWLNAYHKRVREELTPLLGRDAAAWLKKATRTI